MTTPMESVSITDPPAEGAPRGPRPFWGSARRRTGPQPDEHAVFREFFTTHAPAVHQYLARRCPRQDVEDLLAEVMLIAWRRRADIPAEAQLPWLYRTAGYVLANHRRKIIPLTVESVPEQTDGNDPADLVIADLRVRAALATLDERDRRVLLLSSWECLSGNDLAVALGLTRGGAATALSRARARLTTAWEATS